MKNCYLCKRPIGDYTAWFSWQPGRRVIVEPVHDECLDYAVSAVQRRFNNGFDKKEAVECQPMTSSKK